MALLNQQNLIGRRPVSSNGVFKRSQRWTRPRPTNDSFDRAFGRSETCHKSTRVVSFMPINPVTLLRVRKTYGLRMKIHKTNFYTLKPLKIQKYLYSFLFELIAMSSDMCVAHRLPACVGPAYDQRTQGPRSLPHPLPFRGTRYLNYE